MEEVWKQVEKPFENYEVSSLGRVKNSMSGKILAEIEDMNGYIVYNLSNKSNGFYRQFKAHRLVKLMFDPDGYFHNAVVDHINHIRNDNRLENLNWASPRQNRLTSLPGNGASRKPVKQFDSDGNFIQCFDSIHHASIYLVKIGVSHSVAAVRGNIGRVCNESKGTAYGFIWEYRDDPDFPGERWETITVNQTNFVISNYGRFMSKNGVKGFGSNQGNYKRTGIGNKTVYIHRMVALAFLKNNNVDATEVNHKDKNGSNNRVDNLEWVTPSEDIIHAGANKKPIFSIDTVSGQKTIFSSITDASKFYKISRGSVEESLKCKKIINETILFYPDER